MSVSKDCVDLLMSDIGEIERDYLAKRDFQGALRILQCRLMERNYDSMKKRIRRGLHCGTGFCASIDTLVAQLEREEDPGGLQMLKAYASQTSLPMNPNF